MFYYSSQYQKLTWKHKLGLAVIIIMAVALLFLFGVTFLVIALAGGLISLLANLFQGRKKPAIRPSAPGTPYPPFRQKRRHKMDRDDDDVIDI